MNYRNILLIKLSAIGDVIHALPVARVIKNHYPDSRITWVVEKPAYSLLTNNPDIDEIIIFDKPRCKTLGGLVNYAPEFARQLRTRRFDLALDLQGLFKSAAVAWLSRAPQRLGYCNMRELSNLVSVPVCGAHQSGHVVDRYLDVARALGCPVEDVVFPVHITADESAQAEAIAAAAGLGTESVYAVLSPGTNWPTKCWPTSKFARLADLLHERNIVPVIVGAPGDRRLAAEIVAASNISPVDLIGKTTLKQLAHIIKGAKVFVGGDTGPMHLAVAGGTPVVAMFGPSDPDRNGPYQGKNKVLVAKRECVRCQKRACDELCMDSIGVEEMLSGIEDVT